MLKKNNSNQRNVSVLLKKNIKLIDFFGEKEIKNISNLTSQLLTKISLMNKFNNAIFNDDIVIKIEK